MISLILVAILLSALAAFTKMVGALISGSIALLADGADSIINIGSIALATYMFTRSRKPPDAEHPYGHYGFEVLSATLTSIVMAIVMSFIISTTISRLEHHEVSYLSIYFSAISTAILISSVYLFHRISGKYGSLALRAETRHLAADILESVIVLTGVILAVSLSYLYDLITALIVAAFMVYGIALNLKEISESITYKLPSRTLQNTIESIVRSTPGIIECHAIRVRRLGDALFVDMHILVDPKLSIEDAHKLAHRVEDFIKSSIKNIKDIVIHIEPAK